MLMPRVIACLDVRAGRVVKGVRFGGLQDMGEPAALAQTYEAQGADELAVLDVAATPGGRATSARTISLVREVVGIPVTAGGGVRSVTDASQLLEAGADRVVVNSAAVDRPQLIADCAREFGVQCVVVAIDARCEGPAPRWQVVTHGGERRRDLDVVEWAQHASDLGAGEILLTSWDRDGTRSGYDLQLTTAVSTAVTIPVVASGGAASPTDLFAALEAGADAVLAAGIFHSGAYTIGDIKLYLASQGTEVRR